MGGMKIEIDPGEEPMKFSDLEWGDACLMQGRRDGIYVKVGDEVAVLFTEEYFGGMFINIANPKGETVKPMKITGMNARPRKREG